MEWSIFVHKLLVILSATSFFAGAWCLAKSIEFQADKLTEGDNDLAILVNEMGSPGRIVKNKFKWGIRLNGIGYALLLVSTILGN